MAAEAGVCCLAATVLGSEGFRAGGLGAGLPVLLESWSIDTARTHEWDLHCLHDSPAYDQYQRAQTYKHTGNKHMRELMYDVLRING